MIVDLDLGQGAEAARERQDQPLVVQAHARLVGASGVGGRRRYQWRPFLVQRRHRDSCRGFLAGG